MLFKRGNTKASTVVVFIAVAVGVQQLSIAAGEASDVEKIALDNLINDLYFIYHVSNQADESMGKHEEIYAGVYDHGFTFVDFCQELNESQRATFAQILGAKKNNAIMSGPECEEFKSFAGSENFPQVYPYKLGWIISIVDPTTARVERILNEFSGHSSKYSFYKGDNVQDIRGSDHEYLEITEQDGETLIYKWIPINANRELDEDGNDADIADLTIIIDPQFKSWGKIWENFIPDIPYGLLPDIDP